MTRCTRWVQAIAARFYRVTTMERLVDPILTDVELEYRDAYQSGRVWRARGVLIRGYAGLCAALALHAVHVAASASMRDGPIKRTMAFSGAAFVLGTLGFILPPLLNAPWVTRYPGLALYLVPQAIPLSIPIAVSFGILCEWSRNTTGRGMLRRVLVLGMAGALIALAMMEWGMPAGNQAFRVAINSRLAAAGHDVPHDIPRGISERSMSELVALVRLTSEMRPFSVSEYERIRAELQRAAAPLGRELTAEDLQLQLHARVALCFATVLLSFLAVAVARAIGRRNLARTFFAALALLYVDGYVTAAGMVPALSPALSAWLPNAGVSAIAMVLVAIGSRRRDAREPAA